MRTVSCSRRVYARAAVGAASGRVFEAARCRFYWGPAYTRRSSGESSRKTIDRLAAAWAASRSFSSEQVVSRLLALDDLLGAGLLRRALGRLLAGLGLRRAL